MPEPARAGGPSVGIVGRGRVGTALAGALTRAGHVVTGPVGRGQVPDGEAILLCVPDSQIAPAAAAAPGSARFVGHTSGATPLTALAPAERAGAALFGLHPLQAITRETTSLSGSGCAVAGSTPEARRLATTLAADLGMVPFALEDSRRAAYHAAASIASNFLVTLQAAAETIAATGGLAPADARRLLAPLVRTTVDNWASLGPERALTGPAARGDDTTVAAQRSAVAAAAPELLPLFDALLDRTRALAGRPATAAVGQPADRPSLESAA